MDQKKLYQCMNVLEFYRCELCWFSTHFLVEFRRHRQNCTIETKYNVNPEPVNSSEWFQCAQSAANNHGSWNLENNQFHIEAGGLGSLHQDVNIKQEIEDEPTNLKLYQEHNPNEIAKKFECQQCNYQTNFSTNLRRHIMNKHTPPEHLKWFQCDKCPYKAKVEVDLKMHSVVHRKESEIKWFRCDHCDFRSKWKNCLVFHSVSHKEDSEVQWFKCDQCDYKAKSKSYIRRHLVTHKEDLEVDWFQCDHCDYRSKRKRLLTSHSRKHKEVKWFKCAQCNYKSKVNSALRTHIANNHGSNQHHFETVWLESQHVSIKQEIEDEPTNLKLHQAHNPNETVKRFKCQQCNYQTNYSTHLRRHIIDKHTPAEKIQWFQCDQCLYKAKVEIALERHSIIHKKDTEIKWFQCDRCEYKAKRKANLKQHVITHKEGLKVEWFKCNHCDYKSKFKRALDRHSVKHQNDSELKWTHSTSHKPTESGYLYTSGMKSELGDFREKLKNNLRWHLAKKNEKNN